MISRLRHSIDRLTPRSLQGRLVVAFLLTSLAITLLSGRFVFRLLAQYSNQEFDARLADRLRFLKSTLYLREDGVHLKMGEATADWEQITDANDPDYYQVTYADLRVAVSPSQSLSAGAQNVFTMASERMPFIGFGKDEPEYEDFLLPDGRPARGIGVRQLLTLQPKYGGPSKQVEFNTVVAKSRASIETTLAKLKRLIIQSGAAGIAGLLIAMTLIIRRGVRSVEALDKRIRDLPAEKGERLSLPGAPSEVETVVTTLNGLMNRVDEALERERAFTSNAAHELRTPLAGMRTQIELALSRTRSVSEYEDTLLNLKDIQLKLQQLVDNLLLLARLDSGQREFAKSPATLRDLLRGAWKPFFDPAAEKELSISMPLEKEQPVCIFPAALLGIVLRNLLQNAMDYTPAGGKIILTGKVEGSQCQIHISNTNPGLTPEKAAKVFQPFWRADRSGDPNQHNAGIGLALCKRIMQIMEGEISISVTAENLVQFSLVFPVEPNATSELF